MPYISPPQRHVVGTESGLKPVSVGELNYALTKVIMEYLERETNGNKADLGYTLLNNVLGALEGAKLEFYRRVVVPYEDKMKERNGDVY